jgi:hypothetical protein
VALREVEPGRYELDVGAFDTDDGIHIFVVGESQPRVSLTAAGVLTGNGVAAPAGQVTLQYDVGDQATDLTAATNKKVVRAPFAFRLTGVRASVSTAPVGSTIVVDVNNAGTSALSTKLSIDASEKTSVTAAAPAVIDTAHDDFADDAEISIDLDQVGSGTAGKGLKVTLFGVLA